MLTDRTLHNLQLRLYDYYTGRPLKMNKILFYAVKKLCKYIV